MAGIRVRCEVLTPNPRVLAPRRSGEEHMMKGRWSNLYWVFLATLVCTLTTTAFGQAQIAEQKSQFFSVALLQKGQTGLLQLVPGKSDVKAVILVQGRDGEFTTTAPVTISFVGGIAQIPVLQGATALFLRDAPAGAVFAPEVRAYPPGAFTAALSTYARKRVFRNPQGEQFELFLADSSQSLLLVGPAFAPRSGNTPARLGGAFAVDLPGVYSRLVQRFGFALGGPAELPQNALRLFAQGSGNGGAGNFSGGGSGGGNSSGGNSSPVSGLLKCPDLPGAGPGGGGMGDDLGALPAPGANACPIGATRVKQPGLCELCQKLGPALCTICEGPVSCSTTVNCITTEFDLCRVQLGGGQCRL